MFTSVTYATRSPNGDQSGGGAGVPRGSGRFACAPPPPPPPPPPPLPQTQLVVLEEGEDDLGCGPVRVEQPPDHAKKNPLITPVGIHDVEGGTLVHFGLPQAGCYEEQLLSVGGPCRLAS